ncbi:type I-E CRISPR-associated protein Cas5/CasD [Amaricoccus solimangrovi]|uniref:Type I-E CRISPR-associated protein Cas5/CasD n=1 Tax=Amaricoccus solimangrovi TaxID=2589815 RepID=A0A501WEM5_9RHOB|nr:type I-E CRISPR-associated protein Cas5/CasD [Amaricoccus solimangrovi]TPE47868.1 type I-E CRISPR-associated protein Cas5/CasD [Amaricoccus solimangrovi]
MKPHLVFTLTATLAAMGDVAGHERRGSLTWPGRSAILGLLGAARGIERGGDFSALDALGIAVAAFDEGTPLRDYHTVETVPSAAIRRPNSRPEALAAAGNRASTTITLRDYRADALFGVAVWGGDLDPLRAALAAPRFTLYLGRKSCPLSTPPGATLLDAEGPEEALAALILPPWRQGATARWLMTDAEPGDPHVEQRRDQPLDRMKWHFASRGIAIRQVAIRPTGRAA